MTSTGIMIGSTAYRTDRQKRRQKPDSTFAAMCKSLKVVDQVLFAFVSVVLVVMYLFPKAWSKTLPL